MSPVSRKDKLDGEAPASHCSVFCSVTCPCFTPCLLNGTLHNFLISEKLNVNLLSVLSVGQCHLAREMGNRRLRVEVP